MQEKQRVLHIFGGKPGGGVRRTLEQFLKGADQERFDQVVIALNYGGLMDERIQQMGIPVLHVGVDIPEGREATEAEIEANAQVLKFFFDDIEPDLVHGWHYHGDFYSALLMEEVFPVRRPPLVWRISDERNYLETPQPEQRQMLLAGAALSHRYPDYIICASKNVKSVREAMGYDAGKLHVHYNGVDTNIFCPVSEAEERDCRRRFSVPDDKYIFGMAARYDANKGQTFFLEAASRVKAQGANVHFMMCGHDITPENADLWKHVTRLGLQDDITLLGMQEKMEQVLPAANCWVSCSEKEAFSNVVLEVLASGRPIITPAAGIEGEGFIEEAVKQSGMMLSHRDKVNIEGWLQSLVSAMQSLACRDMKEHATRCAEVRKIIEEKYDLRNMVAAYEGIYSDLISQRRGGELKR